MSDVSLSDWHHPEVGSPIELTTGGGGFDDLIGAIDRYGFAIGGFPPSVETGSAIACAARHLGVGEPYVPELYRMKDGAGSAEALTTIQQTQTSEHPAFGSSNVQGWHTDGLLEPIGRIRTSLLHCERPAAAGGETYLLNSGAIFRALAEVDREAADVLLDPTILGRRSTLAGLHAEARGPVFAVDEADGVIRTRYGDGQVEQWYPRREAESALSRALEFFRSRSTLEGRFRKTTRLAAGQLLVLRNDLLSHSRSAYEDDPARPRKLVRALYTSQPRHSAQAVTP